jgi:hypothetical protein
MSSERKLQRQIDKLILSPLLTPTRVHLKGEITRQICPSPLISSNIAPVKQTNTNIGE